MNEETSMTSDGISDSANPKKAGGQADRVPAIGFASGDSMGSQLSADRVEAAKASLSFAIDAARLVRDDKCEDVLLLDVRKLSQVSDYILIGTGTSDRQMAAVLQHVEDMGKLRNMTMFRTNADERSTWLLADFVDLVVHLFEPATRAHYDLEALWGDAPRIEWERPDQRNRDRAGLHTS